MTTRAEELAKRVNNDGGSHLWIVEPEAAFWINAQGCLEYDVVTLRGGMSVDRAKTLLSFLQHWYGEREP